jgi:hypothetical protein
MSSNLLISPTKERWKGLTVGFNCGRAHERKSIKQYQNTYILELNVSEFSKFSNGVVAHFRWYVELYQAHLF